MQDQNIVEHVKSELPRDVFLKIIGIACCDIDTRIRLGIVGKLRIPKDFEERMRALAKPKQGANSIIIQLGYDASIASIYKHKVVMFYNTDCKQITGFQNFGILTQYMDIDTGILVNRCVRGNANDPYGFDPPFSFE